MIGELPLSELPNLLSYAEESEKEKALTPLWVAHYAVSKLSGQEPVPFETLIGKVSDSADDDAIKAPVRTPEAIEFDFEALIQRDRQRIAKGGAASG